MKTFLGKLCKRGHDHNGIGKSLRYVSSPSGCLECQKLWKKSNAAQYRESQKKWEVEHSTVRNEKRVWRYRATTPLQKSLKSAKRRSRLRRQLFDIDLNFIERLWIEQEEKCYWLGVKISFSYPAHHPLKATLDRLDVAKGYVKGNVVWSSHLANIGKGDTGVEEFVNSLEAIKVSIAEKDLQKTRGVAM